mgnify:CR=1 FL=1
MIRNLHEENFVFLLMFTKFFIVLIIQDEFIESDQDQGIFLKFQGIINY